MSDYVIRLNYTEMRALRACVSVQEESFRPLGLNTKTFGREAIACNIAHTQTCNLLNIIDAELGKLAPSAIIVKMGGPRDPS